MAPSSFLREKHLLTVGIYRLLDERYECLPLPSRTLQLMVTNLRNRPLSSSSLDSMKDTVLSLYHNLLTGSKDFPLIPFRGAYRTRLDYTPFVSVEQSLMENTCPIAPYFSPPGSTACVRKRQNTKRKREDSDEDTSSSTLSPAPKRLRL